MITRLVAVVGAVLCLLATAPRQTEAVTSTAPVMCHLEDAASREFKMPGFNYDPDALDVDMCRYACAQISYLYCGLQEGNMCLCANTFSISQIGSSCNTMNCPGDATDVCGAENQNHIFDYVPLIVNLTVHDPGLVTSFETTNITVTRNIGAISEYILENANDFEYTLSYPASPLQFNFRHFGPQEVKVTANGPDGYSATAYQVIQVEARIEGVNLVCPIAVEVNVRFQCMLTIEEGSSVQAMVDLDQGEALLPITPADTLTYTRGEFDALASFRSATTGYISLMVNQIIEHDATLKAFEFNVHTAGVFVFQVFRPLCNDGQVFCYRSYSCIADTTTCSQQQDFWAKRCESGHVYSLMAKACVNPATGQVVQDYFSAWSTMPQTYTLVYELEVNTAVDTPYSTGLLFATAAPHTSVQAGDMLGVYAMSGGLFKIAKGSGSCFEMFNSSSHTVGNALTLNPPNYVCRDESHSVRAHFLKPSKMSFSHNYTGPLVDYNISVIVSNDVTTGPVTVSALVEVQERITGVVFDTVEFAPSHSVVTLTCLPHAGSEVTYNWTFDDGQSESLYEEDITTHVFTEPGVYTVRLVIYNHISTANYSVAIIIQDVIQNLTLTSETVHDESATVFGEITRLIMEISQGTNVTFDMDMDDGTAYQLSHLAIPPGSDFEYTGLNATVGHVYSNLQNYSVTVFASNLVSNATVQLNVPVQIAITSMSILQPDALPLQEVAGIYIFFDSGSNITYSAELDGATMDNITIDEGVGEGGEMYVVFSEEDTSAIGLYSFTLFYDNLVSPAREEHLTVFVQYRIRDVWIFIDRPFVPVDEVVSFNSSMHWGSRFTLHIDWGDGSAVWDEGVIYELDGRAVAGTQDARADPFWIITHTYAAPGNYSVNYTYENIFGQHNFTNFVVVQYPVVDFTLTTDQPVTVMPGPVSGDLEMTITFSGIHLATDPFILYDYNDNSGFTDALTISDVVPHISTHTYIYGTYNVTLNISNLVNHMFFSAHIDVDEPVVDMVVNAIPYYMITNEYANVTVTMTAGTRMTLLWDFQDGATDTQYIDYYTEPMHSVHQYTEPAIHNVTVLATNSHGEVLTAVSNIVVVQHPILNVHCTCEEPHAILDENENFVEFKMCHLWVAIGTLQATDAYYTIEWDDGTVEEERPFLSSDRNPSLDTGSIYHILFFTHTSGYRRGSNYTVAVYMQNLVSNMTVRFTHSLFEEIHNLSMSIVWMQDSSIEEQGFGHFQSIFRLGEPVHFRSGFTRGSHMFFNWDYGDGTSERIMDNPNTVHQYAEPGIYDITLRASNLLSEQTISKRIRVMREASPYTALWTESPYPKNRTHTFNISVANSTLGDIPTGACYRLNFAGDVNDTVHIAFFGNLTQCELSFADYALSPNSTEGDDELYNINDLRITREEVPDEYFQQQLDNTGWANITMWTEYMTIGQWFASLTVVNIVSRVMVNFRMVTTAGFCHPPLVDLDWFNGCMPGYDCHETLGIKTVMRGSESEWKAKLQLRCETSSLTYMMWSASSVDSRTGEETAIDMSLQSNTVEGTNMRQALYNPRTLPYGLNRIYLNVSMYDEIGIWTSNSTEVYVVSSPLRGSILGGSSVSRRWNENVTIDALSLVSDPDVEPGDYSNFTWTYFCKRRCERWPTFDDNYNIVDPTFASTCEYPSGGTPHDQGCFQDDEVEGPIAPVMHGAFGQYEFDSFSIKENDLVDWIVVVWKNGRQLVLRQSMTVVQGDPPDIQIVCRTNCEDLVNPTARFSLMSKINGWRRGMFFDYGWLLFQIPSNYDPEEDYLQYKLLDSRWSSYATTGIRSDNMAINKGLFSGLPKDGYFYRLQVEAVRQGNTLDNKGWGTKDFKINDSPRVGNCSVYPPSGRALETFFNVNCTDPFEDQEVPLSYEIGYRKSETGETTWVYSGNTVTMADSIRLPNGNEESDYRIQVIVQCKDRIGSVSFAFLSVQVLPASLEARMELIGNLTSDPTAFTSSLEQSSPEEAALQVLTVSEVFNDMNSSSLTSAEEQAAVNNMQNQLADPSLSEARRAELEAELEAERRRQEAAALRAMQEQRQNILAAMTRLEPQTTTAVRQVLTATIAMTSKPEQVTSAAVNSSLSIMDSSIRALVTESTRDNVMADDLETAVAPVLQMMGQLRQSIDAQTAMASSETSDGTQEQGQSTQRQVEDQTQRMFEMMNTTGSILMKRKVPGEGDTIIPEDPTASTVMLCSIKFSRDFTGSEYKGGQGRIMSIQAEELVGPLNESTYFISSQANFLSKNPYTYISDNRYNVGSGLAKFELRNDTGEPIVAQNLDQLFEIVLEANGEEPEPISGATTAPGEPMTVHILYNYTIGSALILRVQVNESTLDLPDYNSTTEQPLWGDPNDDFVWRIYIGINRAPTDDDADFNFTLPLTEDLLFEAVQNVKSAQRLVPIETTEATGAWNFTTAPYTTAPHYVITTASPDNVTADNSTSDTTDANMTGNVTSSSNSSSTPVVAEEEVAAVAEEEQMRTEYTLPDRWTLLLSNVLLDDMGVESIYIGLKHERTNSSMSPTATSDVGTDSTVFEPANYSMQAYFSQCLWFVPENNSWSSSGCQVLPLSTYQTTYCGCNHLTSFGSGMVVPMNEVDVSGAAFANLDSNPIVFTTMVCIMGLYVTMVIWARKKDKQDEVKAGTTALLDNDPRDKYLYEIVIWTGQRSNAGTTAKVRMILYGEDGETEPRLIWDDKRPVLQRSGVDSFVMACPFPLGQLTHCRAWHDNSGKNPSWYLSRMQITDMQNEQQYFFIHDRWLAVEEDDGLIDRIIPIAGKEELTSFHHLFWTKTQKNLADGHIWFSVFRRPPRSRFTRVQRLTCCLSLLFASMMANILFYQTAATEKQPQMYRLGPIAFSLGMLYKGFISALIVFPAGILIVAIFRYSAERPVKAHNKNGKKDSTTADTSPDDVARNELEKQKEFLETGDDSKRLLYGSPALPSGHYNRGVSFIQIQEKSPAAPQMPSSTIQYTGLTASTPLRTKVAAKIKKPFRLPWFFIYFGYALALITCGIAFYMTVNVAGGFGPEKSKEWLVSFCVSVIQSIFILQPLKVMLLAIFFALIWKKPEIEKDDRPAHLKPDEEWLHVHLTERDLHDRETEEMLRKYKSGPATLDAEYLKAVREERFKEIQMMSILRDLLYYLVFLYLLMMVGYGNRDPWSIFISENMKNTFNYGNQFSRDYKTYTMSAVHSKPDFYLWLNNSLFPAVFYEQHYDDQEYDFLSGWTADLTSYLIGEVRLRQLRIKPDKCQRRIRRKFDIKNCEGDYERTEQEEGAYKAGWIPVNTSAGEEPDRFWKYRTWSELDGYPFWGRMATYSGGGYVANLGRTRAEADAALDELVEYRWLDEHTRGVFIEFLLFNPNMNLFASSQMLIEFTTSGAGYSFFRFHVMRLNRYIGTFMFVVLAAEVLAVAFIIFFIQREIRHMVREKKKYFTSFWNNMEVVIITLCVVAIVMFFYRLFIGQRMQTQIHKDPMKFHNFQHVIYWDEAYAYVLGLIIFLANLKFTKLLRFNKKLSQLAKTLSYASKGVMSFLLIFIVAFGAFVQLAFLSFYGVLHDFSTIVRTAETMFSLMLNKFNFKNMEEANRLLAPIIVFSFTLFVSFVLINFFLSIVIDAFARVRFELEKQSNEYEIVDFMVERFKKVTGLGNKSKPKRTIQPSTRLEFDPEEYVEGVDPNAATAEELRQRIDRMFDTLLNIIHFRADDRDVERELNQLRDKRRRIFIS